MEDQNLEQEFKIRLVQELDLSKEEFQNSKCNCKKWYLKKLQNFARSRTATGGRDTPENSR